jgi:fatty-acyl-CoA synthase
MREVVKAIVRTTLDFEREPIETWVPASTFRELLESPAENSGSTVAFRYRVRGRLDAAVFDLTFHDALKRERQVANALAAEGLRSGDVVAFMLPLVADSHCVLYGTMAQCTAMPLNYMLHAEHLVGLLHAANARAVIVASDYPDDPEFASKLEIIRRQRPELLVIELARHGGKPDELSVDLRLAMNDQPDDRWVCGDDRSSDDTIALCHTGGTTGLPKLVRQTYRMFQCSTLNHRVTVGYGPDKRILTGLPLFHASGALDAGLFAHLNETTISIGSELGFRDSEFVANFWEIARDEKSTIAAAIPTTVAQWAVQAGFVDVPTLTHVVTGGAPVPVEVARKVGRRLGGRPVIEVWGMTETAGIYSALPLDGEQRTGSVGFTAPYCQLAVVAVGFKNPPTFQSPGDAGEIVVRGPQVTPGYLASSHNDAAWAGDEWFLTGDLGRIDVDGYIWITGRSKDLIIRGGHNIDPAIIDEPAHRVPGVLLAAAVGMPDAHAGEIPVLYVQGPPGLELDEAAVLEHLRTQIPERAAVPKRVFVVDEMPLSGPGKIHKHGLRLDAMRRCFQEVADRASGSPGSVTVNIEDDATAGATVIFLSDGQADLANLGVENGVLWQAMIPFKARWRTEVVSTRSTTPQMITTQESEHV